ncbi:hypothetical protein FA95DRAFT_90826 [Auriscalpium vulgare]|uniref:Uncharacterized protein n=1 Tax=Auriscalpium vulgare TaxID=40419 RepID=A0ACB8RPD9_9AGAM|nr:hypothetical protein FA95DRAFT_90826 [Auriscalpium vulgare]
MRQEVLIILILVLAIVVKGRGRPLTAGHSLLDDIQSILHPPSVPLVSLLRARAQPNQRLVRAFDLHNTFVSDDPDVRKRFIATAARLLRRHSQSSTVFPYCIRQIVEETLQHMSSVDFDTFVQVVTFRIIVNSLLEGEVPIDDADAVVFVVQTINNLWTLSKTCADMPSEPLEQMNSHLRRWLPHLETPLDLVIPTYETMWRVVAIAVARADHDIDARAVFQDYLQDPCEAHFQRASGTRPSVEAFILEVLRLDPPSKRISRARISPSPSPIASCILSSLLSKIRGASPDLLVADIQSLHREPSIWGASASDFDPTRFHLSHVTEMQKAALLPFGYGPLRCVAYKEAPRIAALIAAVLLEASGNDSGRLRITHGPRIGSRDGWGGWRVEICD